MTTHTVPSYLLQPQHPITINLIGCGGTGSQLLTHLARIDYTLRAGGLGYGTHAGLFVRAFDGDTVSEANIGRQNFAPADVGINKAVVLISRINRFYGQNWEAYPEMYDQRIVANELNRVNITITCVDSAKARIEISKILRMRIKKERSRVVDGYEFLNNRREENANAQQKQYYWLDLGNSRNSGQVVLGTLSSITQPKGLADAVSTLPTILDLFPDLLSHDTEEEQGHSCSVAESINSQDLCTNSQMAEWGKKLIWNLFRKMRLETHGVFINLDQMCVNPLPIKNYERLDRVPVKNRKNNNGRSVKAKAKKTKKVLEGRVRKNPVRRPTSTRTRRRVKN